MEDTVVLIVDDDENIREVIIDALSSFPAFCNYRLTIARNGEEALEKIRGVFPLIDLVITDNHMPRMTGISLIDHIKGMHPVIPVILMSAESAPPEHRADRFLRKPEDLSLIPQLVHDLLKKYYSEKAR